MKLTKKQAREEVIKAALLWGDACARAGGDPDELDVWDAHQAEWVLMAAVNDLEMVTRLSEWKKITGREPFMVESSP